MHKNFFLPLCTVALLLAVSLPLSAAPDADRGAVLRDEMETQFQHLERKLSLQVEDAALATARQERRLTELENELHAIKKKIPTQEDINNSIDKHKLKIDNLFNEKIDKVRTATDRGINFASSFFTIICAGAAFLIYINIRQCESEARETFRNFMITLENEVNEKKAELDKIVNNSREQYDEIASLKQETQKTIDMMPWKHGGMKQSFNIENKNEDVEIQHNEDKGIIKNIMCAAKKYLKNEEWSQAYPYWKVIAEQFQDSSLIADFAWVCTQFIRELGEGSPREQVIYDGEHSYNFLVKQNCAIYKMNYGVFKFNCALSEKSKEKRLQFMHASKEIFIDIYKNNPHNVQSIIHLAELACNEANLTEEHEKVKNLQKESKDYFRKALSILETKKDKNSIKTKVYCWGELADLMRAQIRVTPDIRKRKALLQSAATLYTQIIQTEFKTITDLGNFADLRLEQLQFENQPQKIRELLLDAEKLISQILEIDPQQKAALARKNIIHNFLSKIQSR